MDVIIEQRIVADLDAERDGEQFESEFDPFLAVIETSAGGWIDAAEESAANTAVEDAAVELADLLSNNHDMRIYLDICCLKRPFDDQSQPRVHLESEAVLAILDAPADRVELLHVRAHDLENEQNSSPQRASIVREWLHTRPRIELADATLAKRTAELMRLGFKNFDAFHIASAEAARAQVCHFLRRSAARDRATARSRTEDTHNRPIEFGARAFLMNTIVVPNELRQKGFEALIAGLGWVNAVRFIQQYERGRGDYSRERDQMLPSWDAEALIQKARQLP
jgi:hypothetical protein